MASEPHFKYVGLTVAAAGCPNACRHCKDEGGPPYGELMSAREALWAVEQVQEAHAGNVIVPWFAYEVTAHPDFLRLLEFARRRAEASGDPDELCPVLATNGYGIVRARDPRRTLARMREMGIEELCLSFHGRREHHDWFVARAGAFDEILATADLAAEAGLRLCFNIYLDRRNPPHVADLLEVTGRYARPAEDVTISVPGRCLAGRLEAFDADLRPRLWDLEPIRAILAGQWRQPLEEYTEAAWLEAIRRDRPDAAGLPGNDPSAGGCAHLMVDRFFDVYEGGLDRARIRVGNLKRDGAAAVLACAAGTVR